MKTIKIKSISIVNFKGINNLNIDFNDTTNILGENGTGKTSIFDAFTWVLFGKDSHDRKDFDIKNTKLKDKNRQDHEVTVYLDVNGNETVLKRVFRERWTKKRGSETAEFVGNETLNYWNEVPMTQTEYNNKISEILDESLFKMLSSPNYFNSIKWESRRNILNSLISGISDEDVARGNEAFEKIVAELKQGKTLEQYEAQIKASVKKAKEDIKMIPSRIDEVEKGKPEPHDYRVLEIELETNQKQLQKVEDQLSDSNKAFEAKSQEYRNHNVKIAQIESEIAQIEQKVKIEVSNQSKPDTSVLDRLISEKNQNVSDLTRLNLRVQSLSDRLTNNSITIQSLTEKRNALRDQWHKVNESKLEFNDNEFICPTCKRAHEPSNIEAEKAKMLDNFNKDKVKKLADINTTGVNYKNQSENLELEKQSLSKEIEAENAEISRLKILIEDYTQKIQTESNKISSSKENVSIDTLVKNSLDNNNEYQEKLLLLQNYKDTVPDLQSNDNSELITQKTVIQREIDAIKTKLLTKNQLEAAERRKQELLDQERILSAQINDVEKIQFAIDNFTKAKIELTERLINSKFKLVNFRMFEEQINGGYRETCEVMMDGVPYSSLNTASKINAGLDIINTLTEHYQVSAPIFIDNAESVLKLIDVNSQVVRLIVSEGAKSLTIL